MFGLGGLLGRFALGSGLGLPLLGAGLIAGSVFLAYSVHSIKAAGAARVELDRLTEIAQENRAATERYKAGVEATQSAVREAEKLVSAAREEARQAQEKVMALPKSGADTVCPIDCKLP